MELNTVQEIERTINALIPQQRDELCQWLDEQYAQPIDAQLKADLHAGRLDDRIKRAIGDQRAERPDPFSIRSYAPPRYRGELDFLTYQRSA